MDLWNLVNGEHIKKLDDKQLVALLRRLLNQEAKQHGVASGQVCVPDSIIKTSARAKEDGVAVASVGR